MTTKTIPGLVLATTALLASGAPFPVLELVHGEHVWRWHRAVMVFLSTLTIWVLVEFRRSKIRVQFTHSPISKAIVAVLIGSAIITTQRQPTIDAFWRTFLPYLLAFLIVPILGRVLALQWMLNGFTVGIAASLLLYVLGDTVAYRDLPFFSGVWVSRNSLGHVATLVVVLSLATYFGLADTDARNSSTFSDPRLLSGALGSVALWLSHSKSPFMVLPVAIATVVITWFAGAFAAHRTADLQRARSLGLRGMFAIVGGVFAFAAAWQLHPELSGATSRFLTLTERTTLWKAAWGPLMRRPVTGFGLGNVFMDRVRPELAPLTKWDNVHLHNGYLDALAVGGFVLLVLLVILCFHSLVTAFRCAQNGGAEGLPVLILVVTALVLNVTEASWLNTVPHTLLMLNCVVLRVKQPYQE